MANMSALLAASRPAANAAGVPLIRRGHPEYVQLRQSIAGRRRAGMGAVASVGNFLDLPGSSVRDLLAGENPFDQWLSLCLTSTELPADSCWSVDSGCEPTERPACQVGSVTPAKVSGICWGLERKYFWIHSALDETIPRRHHSRQGNHKGGRRSSSTDEDARPWGSQCV